MLIVSLTLIGCKRLLLRNIRYFKITPKEIVQLILGTNGSGKSSIIEYLTPLPADGQAFTKDGSKVIEIVKQGRLYVCASTFDHGSKHSFKIDGEEFNQGGTAKVQRDLVKEHFGITPEIHDLLRGVEKFTAMSPARRREWFTFLCDTDYTYAMSAYDKIRERHGHLVGALKINKTNLVVETAKVMSVEEEARLEYEVGELLKELATLNAERIPLEKSSTHYLTERDRMLRTLSDLSWRLLKNKIIAPLEYNDGKMERDDWGDLKRAVFYSMDQIDDEINRLRHLLTAKEAVMVTANDQYTKQHRHFEILSKAGQDGITTVANQIDEQVQLRSSIQKRIRFELTFDKPQAALDALISIEEELIKLLSDLPNNQDRRFGKSRLASLQADLLVAANERVDIGNTLQRAQAKKDHADEHKTGGKLVCPKCAHTWTIGINEEQYLKLVEEINLLQIAMNTKAKERECITTDMKEIEAYFAQYRTFISYTKNIVVLQPLWEHLLTTQVVLDSPLDAINVIRGVQRDLEHWVELDRVDSKIAELKTLRLGMEEVGDANLTQVQNTLNELTDQLGSLTSEHVRLVRSIADYTDYRRQIKVGNDLAAEIKQIYALAQEHQYNAVEALRRECILHCIQQVEQVLSLKQESLRHAKMQRHVIAKLTEQVNQLATQEEAAKILVKALSPSHGLIAEGLLGFIRCFVGQMNAFIRKIWAYDLQVIPTGYDSEVEEQSSELDYKFKMIVDSPSNIIPDVSRGSDGQGEIVNMAFKMIAIQYLGLTDSPLFFDEPGRTLDDTHRFALSEAMKSLIDNYNYSQMWIISHHAVFHGTFNNADVCVLDRDNITLHAGRKYNQHVIIET